MGDRRAADPNVRSSNGLLSSCICGDGSRRAVSKFEVSDIEVKPELRAESKVCEIRVLQFRARCERPWSACHFCSLLPAKTGLGS